MPEINPQSPVQTSFVDFVREHGSNTTDYATAIADDFSILSGADNADIAHFLCVLHGRHPGVVDQAAIKTAEMDARTWFIEAMEGFAAERAFLTKLTVAAGPISGVSATDQSDTTVLAQRKALEMLSQSDRNGCALGASFALVLDWQAIRPLLEKIAVRLDIEPRHATLPSVDSTLELHGKLVQSDAVERAIHFGVEQILAQHRGLWKLLEARRDARAAAK